MLSEALSNCNKQIDRLECCKTDETPCNCVDALSQDYKSRSDSYDCPKKMNTYVLRYGPAYVSEIYHYLVESDFKKRLNGNKVRVASLGCGFAPDFYALEEYLSTYKPEVELSYTGADTSTCWDIARPVKPNCKFKSLDLTKPFEFGDVDVVIIGKVFSTLYRNGVHVSFLDNLKSAIKSTLPDSAIVIFTDINHYAFGRDVFHNSVSAYLPNFTRYYFDGYEGYGWHKIPNNYIVCDVPDGLSVSSLDGTGKTVVFEYRK